jgi:succinate-acetate transporter protein
MSESNATSRNPMRLSGDGPQEPASPDGPAPRDGHNAHDLWESKTRVFLSPLSPPSIIGLYGFMGATLMVGAWQAGWYGNGNTGFLLWPFAAIFGGIFQGGAAFPALKARDGLAAGIHATWGAFWIGFGLLFALASQGLLKAPAFGTVSTPFAFWFIVLALITGAGALIAIFDNWAIAGVLNFLAAGSAITAAGWWSGNNVVLEVGGILFVISAVIALYTATAMVAENVLGRTVLPVGHYKKAANKPGAHATVPLQYEQGMPGVKVGQ